MNDTPRLLGNRYEIGELLGRGGMAEVHLGRDTRLGRTVAIKLLRTDLARDATFQARFRREAQSAAALNHPAIVSVYDTGEEVVTDSGGGIVPLPYIVMEYVEGRTLRDMLRGGQPLDTLSALEITSGVLAALEYSHKAGIVHRDIKPANVMVTPRGDVKVMDFGIARALADASATMTQTQAVIGTAQYLSPEQARGETVDARSDLYSAGCLLYELLTARPPFVADSPVAVAYQHVREMPQPPSVFNPAIPEVVDRVVLHSLSKDRESRYQSAAQFRADVDSLRSGRPVQAYASAGAAAAAGATTEFMPPAAAGTRAMPPVAPGSLLGGPAAGLPVGEPDDGWDDEPPGQGRRAGYVLLALAVVAVFGVVAFLVANSIGDRDPAVSTVKVPAVVGAQQAKAEADLTAAGFEVKVVTAASEDEPEGTVLAQDPPAGADAEPNSEVTITVSAGSDTVEVPKLEGASQEQARNLLEQAGLEIGNVTEGDSPDVPKGKVISSDPPAGDRVAKGSTVSIVVSSGEVEVPDFTGKSYDEARKALRKLGLQWERTSVPSADEEPGTVLEQDPRGGSIEQGGTVRFVVAVAPEPTVEPTPTETPSPTPTPTLTPTPTPTGTPTPTP